MLPVGPGEIHLTLVVHTGGFCSAEAPFQFSFNSIEQFSGRDKLFKIKSRAGEPVKLWTAYNRQLNNDRKATVL